MSELLRRTARGAVVPLVAALPIAMAAPVAAAAPDQECTSLEGCYSYDEMDDFLDVAQELVLDFAFKEYSPQLLWVELRYVAEGESGESACLARGGVRARYSELSYEYCPANNTIYIGQKTLWSFYSEIGDVAPIVGLAHEFGHFMQSKSGVPAPSTPQESIHHENQADCFAGAWFAYADETGLVERPDDLEDIDLILDRIGSSEDEKGRTHGTVDERKRSFEDGRVGGLARCNAYYPTTPVRSEAERDRWRALLTDLRHLPAVRRKRQTHNANLTDPTPNDLERTRRFFVRAAQGFSAAGVGRRAKSHSRTGGAAALHQRSTHVRRLTAEVASAPNGQLARPDLVVDRDHVCWWLRSRCRSGAGRYASAHVVEILQLGDGPEPVPAMRGTDDGDLLPALVVDGGIDHDQCPGH
jgi:hypothetical protein